MSFYIIHHLSHKIPYLCSGLCVAVSSGALRREKQVVWLHNPDQPDYEAGAVYTLMCRNSRHRYGCGIDFASRLSLTSEPAGPSHKNVSSPAVGISECKPHYLLALFRCANQPEICQRVQRVHASECLDQYIVQYSMRH